MDADVAEYLQMRHAQIVITTFTGACEELLAELAQESPQKLPDREPVGRKVA